MPVDQSAIPAVTLALGLAVREGDHSITGVKCDLRWPNDLLARDRKFCGILTQIHSGAVIAGIGINVNQTGFPGTLHPSPPRCASRKASSSTARSCSTPF